MSSFTNFDATLKIEYLNDLSRTSGKDYWRILEPFSFYLDNGIETIYVPEGFITDGATIPQMFWDILPVMSTYGQAAVVHDFLLEGGKITHTTEKTWRLSNRAEARSIFNSAMKVLKVNPIKRCLIIAGVFIWDQVKRVFPSKLKPRDFNKELLK